MTTCFWQWTNSAILLDEKTSRILYANGKLSEVEVKKIHSNYEKCTYNKCNQRVEHF